MISLAERSREAEQMDAESLDSRTYEAILGDLARVNRLTLAYRPTLSFLARAIGGRRRFRLLDIGFGHGDMLRAIARWAARRSVAAELIGIDLNPRSAPIAERASDPGAPISYLTGDYRDLAGEGFDFVVSSLVAHHMEEDELVGFLRFMEAEAQGGWMVNDLHRHRLAHFGFPILARAMRFHSIVREDGRLSIARAFRAAEWRALLDRAGVSGARIVRRFPFRLCVERIR